MPYIFIPFRRFFRTLLGQRTPALTNSFISTQIPSPCMQCTGKVHLETTLQWILAGDGEGIVIRNPTSVYQHGRSDKLFKIKVQSNILKTIKNLSEFGEFKKKQNKTKQNAR
jgi:ATP-dependent DNA ligase